MTNKPVSMYVILMPILNTNKLLIKGVTILGTEYKEYKRLK